MNKTKQFSRRLSFNERLYLASLKNHDEGLLIQFVLDGEGDLTEKELQKAVSRAAEANPASRLRLHGHLGYSRWIADGPIPPVRSFERFEEDGSLKGLGGPLSPRKGPVCELILFKNPRLRIVIRCLHSVMDGGGLFLFLEDVFRALRDEVPLGAESELNDSEYLISIVGRRYRKPLRMDAPRIGGEDGGPPGHVHWLLETRRLSKLPAAVPARIAVSLSQAFDKGQGLRVMIPTDVRNYQRKMRNLGNLSYPLFLDINKHDTAEDIQNRMFKALLSKEMLYLDPFELKGVWFPLFVLRLILKLGNVVQTLTKKNVFSAFLSHTVIPKASSLHSPQFRCKSMSFLPTEFKLGSLAITTIAVGQELSVTIFGAKNWLPLAKLEAIRELVWVALEEGEQS